MIQDAGGSPGGFPSDPAPLQKQDRHSLSGQMVSDGAADDSRTDDNDVCGLRLHHGL